MNYQNIWTGKQYYKGSSQQYKFTSGNKQLSNKQSNFTLIETRKRKTDKT